MATTAILAPTAAGGTSGIITVTAATPATVTLFQASGATIPALFTAAVQKQNSSTAWGPTNIQLGGAPGGNGHTGSGTTLAAVGVYRVVTPVSPNGELIGVDLDQ